MINRMSDKEFEGDPLDYTALFVEARRAREAEISLEKACKIMAPRLLGLEKENADLRRKLAKWMHGKDGRALRAEMRGKEPT